MSAASYTQSSVLNPRPLVEMVFIHGAGSNGGFWYWQRPAFPGAHFLDLPGHGHNHSASLPHPAQADSPLLLEQYADWVEDYVQSNRLSSVVLNGHSMGGAIALLLALRRPAWLRAMVLVSTGARLPVDPGLLTLLRSDYLAAVEVITEASFAPQNGVLSYAQKVRVNGTRRQLLKTPQAVTLADYEACSRLDLTRRVQEIDLPTLCIVGTQDAVTPVEVSEYLHKTIRGSRLEVIESAGHMLPIERPEEYNGKIASFIERLAAI